MKPQVRKEHYLHPYDSKGRFCSYWTQIEYVLKTNQQTVLEIGVGNRTVTDYLRKQGRTVCALDLDPELRPNVAASVSHLPFRDDVFGVVMACEVLEHLPFELFGPCLCELLRVSRQYAVLSLPNSGKAWTYHIYVPRLGPIRHIIELPWLRRRDLPVGQGEHFWEIEVKGYERSKVERVIKAAGWHIIERQRVWEFPGHQFYFLEKRGKQ